mmetsp:Transcript_18049/g.20214  ORF Transcript_18049/g.20214 Transcript_18049/m.20214 type:complete len:403 (+) Transcript_18049:1-1209(+)
MDTMFDLLGFTPKVDFNAGVVAAGEAIIESTVIGNQAKVQINSVAEGLVNQQQVYLPTNNALSNVGHVHLFLEEVGQGIQHVASRVQDLVGFIQRTNNYRKMTGEGFSFLNIPRSYYGRLTIDDMVAAGLSDALARGIRTALESAKVTKTGVVELDVTEAMIDGGLAKLPQALSAEYAEKREVVVKTVMRSRYVNLEKMMGDHLGTETYLGIVRNKVLVDIQGQDVLYQIFTSNVLQRNGGEESPFFEFIQRVCSERLDVRGQPVPIRPGCGGFGIRNFLTLFLSIEVSKAMRAVDDALACGDKRAANTAEQMVDTLTKQMDEANPVLTKISDAMTAEADALLELKHAGADAKAELEAAVAKHRGLKEAGSNQLKEISNRYKGLMAAIRESAQQPARKKQKA